ncbi:MAG: carbamoyltransferase HypF [Pseudomonadota bacterium]
MSNEVYAEQIRVRGLVQGVGFRPTVWRLANACHLFGEVWNDSKGVIIHAWGERQALDHFCQKIQQECPPLARIDSLDRSRLHEPLTGQGFRIVSSRAGPMHTGIVPDAATCPACQAEIIENANRRYRYPFTNCTHCGPRLTIINAVPYDRENTSMRCFTLCAECQAEYDDPADRRFHAQPNACPVCGPRVWLLDAGGAEIQPALQEDQDTLQLASRLLAEGQILAIKGIGGFHLACDATNSRAVDELRGRKGRYHKPFALMAREMAVIRRYCSVSEAEAACLQNPAAPILLLEQSGETPLPPAVAPGQNTLGFMLPYSPLHQLLLSGWDRPLVMTSGNLSEEPQCTDNQDAVKRLGAVADAFLLHDREIVNRVDDSVVKVMAGSPRLLRRARGYAPRPIQLPPGFAAAAALMALGGELKSTLCLLKDGQAILSQHLGDLENEATFRSYQKTLNLYLQLYDLQPRLLVGDQHPNYRSTRFGREWALELGVDWLQVQHHHAHIASVMAENQWPLEAGQVLGIAMDGTGYGSDGSVWGGEFLLADYLGYERLGLLRPTPLPGGAKAILQPWRNSFAQLHSLFGWEQVMARWGGLEAIRWLDGQPLELLIGMIERELNAPLSSSCGRLFDALAGLLGICREQISYEGQAAIELEAMAGGYAIIQGGGYPFALTPSDKGLMLDPQPFWLAVLTDLEQGVPHEAIAARFHAGLADAITDLALRLAGEHKIDTVALSGGVFQNRTLFERVAGNLQESGLNLLSHQLAPANDGGLSLGQAVIGAARQLRDSDSC